MLLVIDNYDSFTHNLARYFAELGCDVTVVRNDQTSLAELSTLPIKAIVISPGPCTPNESGISLSVIREFAGKVPILGVCLGHQAIGQVFGASVVGAREIKHGKVSVISHNAHPLFDKVPSQFNATRYHSLVIQPETIGEHLQIIAWHQHEDGYREIMAICHQVMPLWGVQFHPESLLTDFGHQILHNFLQLAGYPHKSLIFSSELPINEL